MNEDVILIDNNDQPIGTMPKMEAHILGRLHRAFSIFIFNKKGELLLQQRAMHKYHSGGKWTNTCCSHPRVGESTLEAAKRRLGEEMGMVCRLDYMFSFTYKAEVEQGLIENEFDHVYFGISDEPPSINPAEVAAHRYVSMEDLQKDLTYQPDIYSEWLKIAFQLVLNEYRKNVNYE